MVDPERLPDPGLVLVVDDDTATRVLITKVLEHAGLRTLQADSGEKGLSVLRQRSTEIDCVVLDVRMPGLSGYDVLEVVRAEEALSPIPVLLLTAHADTEEDLVTGATLGAIDHLSKPFSAPVLAAKVKRAIQQRRAQRDAENRLEAAERLARIDPLTQLGNRQLFYERLREESAYARRKRTAFALIVCDLDYFKKLNDGHGHDTGDKALVHFARTMQAAIRQEDSAFRYGGEEFVVLLRGSDARGAQATTARLRNALRLTPIPLPKGGEQAITFSAGIAIADEANEFHTEGLFSRADEALYRAKGAGRDRDELATEEHLEPL